MKKIIAVLLTLVMAAAMLAGCQSDDGETVETIDEVEDKTEDTSENTLKVVTTIFPQYDIVREIAGDQVELKMLLSPGAESHSYDPSPQDIIDIQESDIFIYVGGDSDEWVDRILESVDTEDIEIISLMDMVEVVEEELVEGMEDGHDHDHGTTDFEDEEVEDRDLTDWSGQWQSVYPYLLDGTLDEVLEHKAEESEDMDEDAYHVYYETGYKTDTEQINIDADTMEFITEGVSAKAEYQYDGFEILHYESGSKGVRYLFSSTDEESDAPAYVQFSDHMITPSESEHFHIYFGDESHEALLEEMDSWPTYYPDDMTGADIVEEMLEHEDSHDHDEEEEEEVEYDEHVWTSPENAQILTKGIAEVLCKKDEGRREVYETAAASYVEKLEELDQAFRDVVEEAQRTTILVGDRFPFRYFVDAYGLDYFAAFSGCSTETDASAGTLAFLIEKVKEESLPVVFHIELSDEKITDTICEETGAEKLLLHSGHNITKDDFENGVTYLDLMNANVESLKKALQ